MILLCGGQAPGCCRYRERRKEGCNKNKQIPNAARTNYFAPSYGLELLTGGCAQVASPTSYRTREGLNALWDTHGPLSSLDSQIYHDKQP